VLAGSRIEQMRAQVSPRVDSTALALAKPLVDTMSFVASRDSVARLVDSSRTELARLRGIAVEMDARDEAERARQTPVAPTLAILAAACVLSGVVGFAFAFIGELRHPRVSDATETERVLRTRVLANIEPLPASAERHRRAADRNAPRHLEPFGEGYQLTYLGLATAHPAQLGVTVTGDDASVAAVVACNLAAVAADEARNAVIFDLTANANASAALRSRRGPGISDVVRGDADWADATTAIAVGRGKTIDLIPRGTSALSAQDALSAIARDVPRFNRYYDAVFVLMDAETACAPQAQLAERDLVYCARPGITTLSLLRTHLEAARASDAFLRGLVLWKLPHPQFAAERESQAPRAPIPAVAAVNS
jgi:Mrp family chromosome partitioning ATPase